MGTNSVNFSFMRVSAVRLCHPEHWRVFLGVQSVWFSKLKFGETNLGKWWKVQM